tara:strand:- start:1231 stop:1467 length:237 start_codon:yes stop_codon:yes gene_type:complete
MVLGMILYESVDLAYNVVKLGYNGIRGTYYWWYGMDYPEVQVQKDSTKALLMLEDRIHHLERLLEDVEKSREQEAESK